MPILQHILTIKRKLSQTASRQAMEIERRRISSTNQRKMLWRKEDTRYQVLSTTYLENLCLYLLEMPGGKEETLTQQMQWGDEVIFCRLQHWKFSFYCYSIVQRRYLFFPPPNSDTWSIVEVQNMTFYTLLLVFYFRQIAFFQYYIFWRFYDLGMTLWWPWNDLKVDNHQNRN